MKVKKKVWSETWDQVEFQVRKQIRWQSCDKVRVLVAHEIYSKIRCGIVNYIWRLLIYD
jgi:hypothetical protein